MDEKPQAQKVKQLRCNSLIIGAEYESSNIVSIVSNQNVFNQATTNSHQPFNTFLILLRLPVGLLVSPKTILNFNSVH